MEKRHWVFTHDVTLNKELNLTSLWKKTLGFTHDVTLNKELNLTSLLWKKTLGFYICLTSLTRAKPKEKMTFPA